MHLSSRLVAVVSAGAMIIGGMFAAPSAAAAAPVSAEATATRYANAEPSDVDGWSTTRSVTVPEGSSDLVADVNVEIFAGQV